jgi:hypothetical protein
MAHILYYMNPEEALALNPELLKENVKQALILCNICNEKKNITPENNETLLPNFRFIPNYRAQVYYSHTSQCLTKKCIDRQEEIKAQQRADKRFWNQVECMEARCAAAEKRSNDAYNRGIASSINN